MNSFASLCLALLYLTPSIVAGSRSCRHNFPIATVNLLLGWTGIGWLVALSMAVVDEPKNGWPKTV